MKTKNLKRKGRFEGFLDPKSIAQLERLAKAEDRPIRWLAGKLVKEALEARENQAATRPGE